MGEGEFFVIDLAKRLLSGKDLDTLSQCYFRKGNAIVKSSILKKEYKDLDKLAYNDFSDFFNVYKGKHKDIMFPIEGARGCHWNRCHFCFLNQGYKYRHKSAAIILYYQNDNFCIKTGVIANQYATRGITTQLGINGFLEYKISRHWSLAVYGTIYDFNPYFSMATFPFIETTSYGGWIKYEGEKMGVKLGARRYYDAFQKQWKMEPIITPSIKIGKKMYFELPVGPLVQRSMEKLLKRQTNNSPVITPNLK